MLIGANWVYDPSGGNAPQETWDIFALLNPTEVLVPSHISRHDVDELLRLHPNLLWHVRTKGNRKWLPDSLYSKEWENETSPIELVRYLIMRGVKPVIIIMNEVDIELTADWHADDPQERIHAMGWYLKFADQAIDDLSKEFGPSGLDYDVALSPLSQGGPIDRFTTWFNKFKDSGLLARTTRVVDHCYFANRDFSDNQWGSRYQLIADNYSGPIDITETNDNGKVPTEARAMLYAAYIFKLWKDGRIASVSLFCLPGGAQGDDWWPITADISKAVAALGVGQDNNIPPVVVDPETPIIIDNTQNCWEFWNAHEIVEATNCDEANVKQYWPVIYEALAAHNIISRNTQAAIIATIAIETASRFEPIDEYKNIDGSIPEGWYSYGGGPNFHGRGFIQLTHDYNYQRIGDALGFDLLHNPDLAKDPFVASMILANYCASPRGNNGLSVADEANIANWEQVRRKVQGGVAGLDRLIQICVGLLDKPIIPDVIIPPIKHIFTELELLQIQFDVKQAEIVRIISAFAQVCDVWVPQMISTTKANRKALAKAIADTRVSIIGPKPE